MKPGRELGPATRAITLLVTHNSGDDLPAFEATKEFSAGDASKEAGDPKAGRFQVSQASGLISDAEAPHGRARPIPVASPPRAWPPDATEPDIAVPRAFEGIDRSAWLIGRKSMLLPM